MENASKALIMAGGVLISLIIIALLVFFFNNLSDLQNTKLSSEEVEQAVEFNKQFDVYARNVYGSELLSLANKVVDYNKREADNKGYLAITLEVVIKDDIDKTYFRADTYNQIELVNKIKDLENKIDVNKPESIANITINFSQGSRTISRKISKLATMRDADIANLGTADKDYKDLVTQYNTLKSLITEIKAKEFEYKIFEYDEKGTGRIIKMCYYYGV